MRFADSIATEVRQYTGHDSDLVHLAPTLFTALANLLDEPQLGPSVRMQVAAAMGYFVAPFDAVPESEGALGWVDDVFVALHVLRTVRDQVGDGAMDIAWPDQRYSGPKLDEWYARCHALLGGHGLGALRFIGLDHAPSDV